MKSVGPLPRKTHTHNSFANTFRSLRTLPSEAKDTDQTYEFWRPQGLPPLPDSWMSKMIGQERPVSKERNIKTTRQVLETLPEPEERGEDVEFLLFLG